MGTAYINENDLVCYSHCSHPECAHGKDMINSMDVTVVCHGTFRVPLSPAGSPLLSASSPVQTTYVGHIFLRAIERV